MKITPGFDGRNVGAYRWALCGFALASALMVMTALSGKYSEASPGRLHALLWPAIACIVSIFGYISAAKYRLSFRYLAGAGFSFSLAMYGFGMSMKLVVLVGFVSLVGMAISVIFGEKVDKQVEDDDFKI